MSKRRDKSKLAEELAALTDQILAGEQVAPTEAGDLKNLTETVKELHRVTQADPSPAFAARLRNLALAALPKPKETISKRLSEVISRLMGDEDFRNNFFASPETTLQRSGYQLSAAEIAALKEMEPENLEEWMTDLDERISKSGML